LDVSEFWIIGISLRKYWCKVTPIDSKHRIVPENAVLVGWSIVITAFVKELNGFGEREKSVRESNGDIDLILLFGGQENAGPFAEVGRTDSDVGDYIQSFTLDDTTELGLRVAELIVKAAKRTAGRNGVIVLREGVFDAQVSEFSMVVRFEERAARIAMDQRTQFIDAW
jgi:hypothetical protein